MGNIPTGQSFEAVDAAGTRYDLEHVVLVLGYPEAPTPNWQSDHRVLVRKTGEAVTRIDKGHYRTKDGVDLHSESPSAP